MSQETSDKTVEGRDRDGDRVAIDSLPIRLDIDVDRSFWVGLYLLIADFFYPFFRILYDESSYKMKKLEKQLIGADIRQPVEVYLSAAIGISLLTAVGASLFFTFVGIFVFDLSQYIVPFVPDLPFGPADFENSLFDSLVGGTVAFLIGFPIAFMTPYYIITKYPSAISYSRGREIDLALPDATAFLYSLSVGGMSELEVFKALADADETYGEVSNEFQRIVKRVEYFNVDYQTAIRQVAQTTPSDDLSKLLTDILAVINSGGNMTNFLESQKDEQMRQLDKTQERQLDTLETFGEVYMSLNVLPFLMFIVVMIMAFVGQASAVILGAIVYIVTPMFDLAYIVLVSTVKVDEIGDGTIDASSSTEEVAEGSHRFFDLSVVRNYSAENPGLFRSIRRKEVMHRFQKAWANKWEVLKEEPRRSAIVTVPLAIAFIIATWLIGLVSLDPATMYAASVRHTALLFYCPVLLVLLPMAYLRRQETNKEKAILETLTGDLRKLANTNDAGQTLLESFKITSRDKGTRLSDEFGAIYNKVHYGRNMDAALVEFTNSYKIPRLARAMKLVQKAQESSSHITDVLKTAADLSEKKDDLEEERKTRTRMQLVIIGVTFGVFVLVMLAMDQMFAPVIVKFLGSGSGGGGISQTGSIGGSSISREFLNMLFFHAVTLKAILTGMIIGYVDSGSIRQSDGYIALMLLMTGIVWIGVTALL